MASARVRRAAAVGTNRDDGAARVEVIDDDLLELPRLVLTPRRRAVGELHRLIRAVNELPVGAGRWRRPCKQLRLRRHRVRRPPRAKSFARVASMRAVAFRVSLRRGSPERALCGAYRAACAAPHARAGNRGERLGGRPDPRPRGASSSSMLASISSPISTPGCARFAFEMPIRFCRAAARSTAHQPGAHR